MKYTQAHAKNAVAARARKRAARAMAIFPSDKPRRVPKYGKGPAAVSIQIRDWEVGDSLTLTLRRGPWSNRWYCEQGEYSTAQICAALKHILQSAAKRW
jgi:hypothetical protein